MNWQETADDLASDCLAQLRAIIGSEPADRVSSLQARAALKALEVAISLGREATALAEREQADIRAFLELDPARQSEAPCRVLAKRLRERAIALEGPAGVRLHDLLLRGVVARLRLVNPRYIAARQRRAESSY